jgi:FkbM family methyltransferase
MAMKLRERFKGVSGFTLVEAAAGESDGIGKLHLVRGADGGGDVDTQLSSLIEHPLYEGLTVASEIEVKVARLERLRSEGLIPSPLGVLKIDTEGHDLSVLRGAGELDAEVICVEFWNRNFVFNDGRVSNDVEHYLEYFKSTPYQWHLELYRRDSESKIAVRVHTSGSLSRSWGNAYFFRDEAKFNAFLGLCADILGPDALEFC